MAVYRTDDGANRLRYKVVALGFEWTFSQWITGIAALMLTPFAVWQLVAAWPTVGLVVSVAAGMAAGYGTARLVGLSDNPDTPLTHHARALLVEVSTPRPPRSPHRVTVAMAPSALRGHSEQHRRHPFQPGGTP